MIDAEYVNEIPPERSYVFCIDFTQDQEYVIAGYDDGVIRQWKLSHYPVGVDGKPVSTEVNPDKLYKGHGYDVNCLVVAGDYLFSGSGDTTMR